MGGWVGQFNLIFISGFITDMLLMTYIVIVDHNKLPKNPCKEDKDARRIKMQEDKDTRRVKIQGG